MRKSEIVNEVMALSGDFTDVEIRTTEEDDQIPPGMVYIIVSVDQPLDTDRRYNLRIGIQQALEPMRPAGVGYEILVKTTTEIVIIGTVNLGPMRMVQTFNTPEEVMEAFGGDPPPAWPQRSRFHALADEMTAEIAPLKKPSIVEQPAVRRLFEQTIDVQGRTMSPCPKCGCQAFTPNQKKDRVICRGCPLPAPSYAINNIDAWGFDTRRYKCGSCGRIEPVTMLMSEINLYCAGCSALTLHNLQDARPEMRAARMRLGEALIKFQNIVIGKATGVTITEMETSESKFPIYPDELSGEALKEALDMVQANPVPNDWVTAIEMMQQRVSSTLGIPADILDPDPTSSAAAGLFDMFRVKLGLRPFSEFAKKERDTNIRKRELRERDFDRRTGRTTRGMLFAIAEFMVSEMRLFCVVGHTERYTKDLANDARRMYELLNLSRAMPIRPLMPNDFDPRYDYKREGAHVYVDHVWAERELQRR